MIYVMSDIHGNLSRFRSIMYKIDLQATDHLYVIGDVIDRFPDGLAILQEMMKMPNCTVLLGDHEWMLNNMVSHAFSETTRDLWFWNGGKVTYADLLKLPIAKQNQIIQFIRRMPVVKDVCINGNDYLLVHGAPPELYNAYSYEYDNVDDFVVWHRLSEEDELHENKIVVFGHTNTKYYQNGHPAKIWFGKNRIGIDCGSGSIGGRLACLRLDDMTEFYSDE